MDDDNNFDDDGNLDDDRNCLTKSDLVNAVYDVLDVDKQRAATLVEDYLELLKDTLATEGRVMLSGFGAYEVNYKEARRGRNPQTGQPMTLRERRVVKFKPSQILRKEMNPKD